MSGAAPSANGEASSPHRGEAANLHRGEAANPHRGEAALVLDGIEHVLRPTFNALVAAEEELGPLFALVERASGGKLKLAEQAALFWHCLRDREGADRTGFCEALARAGLAACAPVLRALLVQILKGKA